MKRITGVGVLALTGVAGACGQHAASMRIDQNTSFVTRVEGGPQDARAGFSLWGEPNGGKFHRVLRNADGKTLFAYDGEIRSGEEKGSYRLILKPVAGSPTFAKSREVIAHRGEDEVRVELVEDSISHRKIVDVLQLTPPGVVEDPMGALVRFHNHIFRMVHGK